jgi:3-dehydroquinate synthase
MKNIVTTFEAKDTVDFVVDDEASLKWLSEINQIKFDRLIVVIDKNVQNIWGEKIFNQLRKNGKEIISHEVDPCEESKSTEYYPVLVDFLEKNRGGRFDLVIAIGGGIVIDLVSFTVSTYMRGLPLYVIATTLIGQVDASTAGKTCLNTQSNKNLLGTFYYPLVVYNNTRFLSTNNERILRQGFSEVFKYGLLDSKDILNALIEYKENKEEYLLEKIILLTIKSRIAIRKKDALASNLGHTFGHALEKYSSYKILHGDAIAMGTVMALSYAVTKGILSAHTKNKIIEMMMYLELNIYLDTTVEAEPLVNKMMSDKKSSSKTINLVLLEDIEKPYSDDGGLFYKADPSDVVCFLKDFISKYNYRIDHCDQYLLRDKIEY